MTKRYLWLVCLLAIVEIANSQEKWNLEQCVLYALENNISVRQTDIQAQYSALALRESRAIRLPAFSFSANAGNSFGLSENPTTGILENNTFFNSGAQLQAQVSLFNWFSRKNTVEANRITYEADREQTQKVRNDIALNVAVAYLQVLLAREQVSLAEIQIEQTRAQLDNTQKQVDAGRLPELSAAQLESQLATDSSTLITAEASARQFKLQLKALLNLDASASFDVETPPVDMIPVESLADLQPEYVFETARANMPQQKVNSLRIEAAIKQRKAAWAAMYPNLSAFGGLDTRYVHFQRTPLYNQVITGYIPTGLRADGGGGVYYNVEQPTLQRGNTVLGYIESDALGKQLRNNFGQTIGLAINVPLFNGLRSRTGWERSKLALKNLELTQELDRQQLKQDIYKAYNDASAALQKFNANKKGVEVAQKAYDFSDKRYELGLLSTFELISSQGTLRTARTNLLYAQYDYIFKIKLLEFYKGQGLKL